MGFDKMLLQFRAKHNLTQAQLAEILGVATNTVHRLESDKNKPTKRNEIAYESKMKEWEMVKNDLC